MDDEYMRRLVKYVLRSSLKRGRATNKDGRKTSKRRIVVVASFDEMVEAAKNLPWPYDGKQPNAVNDLSAAQRQVLAIRSYVYLWDGMLNAALRWKFSSLVSDNASKEYAVIASVFAGVLNQMTMVAEDDAMGRNIVPAADAFVQEVKRGLPEAVERFEEILKNISLHICASFSTPLINESKDLVVFRGLEGQPFSLELMHRTFVSTSSSIDSALQFSAKEDGLFVVLHIAPRVPYLDIKKLLYAHDNKSASAMMRIVHNENEFLLPFGLNYEVKRVLTFFSKPKHVPRRVVELKVTLGVADGHDPIVGGGSTSQRTLAWASKLNDMYETFHTHATQDYKSRFEALPGPAEFSEPSFLEAHPRVRQEYFEQFRSDYFDAHFRNASHSPSDSPRKEEVIKWENEPKNLITKNRPVKRKASLQYGQITILVDYTDYVPRRNAYNDVKLLRAIKYDAAESTSTPCILKHFQFSHNDYESKAKAYKDMQLHQKASKLSNSGSNSSGVLVPNIIFMGALKHKDQVEEYFMCIEDVGTPLSKFISITPTKEASKVTDIYEKLVYWIKYMQQEIGLVHGNFHCDNVMLKDGKAPYVMDFRKSVEINERESVHEELRRFLERFDVEMITTDMQVAWISNVINPDILPEANHVEFEDYLRSLVPHVAHPDDYRDELQTLFELPRFS